MSFVSSENFLLFPIEGNEQSRDWGGTLVSTLMGQWPVAYMLIYIPLLGVIAGYNTIDSF